MLLFAIHRVFLFIDDETRREYYDKIMIFFYFGIWREKCFELDKESSLSREPRLIYQKK